MTGPKIAFLLYALIAISGAGHAWKEIRRVELQPLQPDVISYQALAKDMKSPYDTGIHDASREPLTVWVPKITQVLFGPSDLWMRIVGVSFFFLGALGVLGWVLKLTNSHLAAAAAFFVFSHNKNLLELGVEAMRDIYVLAFLAFWFLSVAPGWKNKTHQTLLLCASSALMVLSRITMLAPVLACGVVAIWRRRMRPRAFVLSIATTLALLTPHLAYNFSRYNDPWRSLNQHANWWRNYEFVVTRGIGCDGCPTREEFNTKPYSGKPVSGFGWIFGMHSLPDVVSKTTVGMATLLLGGRGYLTYLTGQRFQGRFLLYFLGLLCIVAIGEWHLILFQVLWINILAFTLMVDMPQRLFTIASPLICAAMGIGLAFLVGRAVQFAKELRRLHLWKASASV